MVFNMINGKSINIDINDKITYKIGLNLFKDNIVFIITYNVIYNNCIKNKSIVYIISMSSTISITDNNQLVILYLFILSILVILIN